MVCITGLNMEGVMDDCQWTWVKGMMRSGMTGMEVKLKATTGTGRLWFFWALFFSKPFDGKTFLGVRV